MKKKELSLWLLAAVPLLVSILLHILSGDSRTVFILVFLLNLLLVSCDYFSSRKDTGHPLYVYLSGLVLIPLYIYFRAVKHDRKYRFLIVWGVLYAFDLVLLQMGAV